MAKGQKRNSREPKKPKAKKPIIPAARPQTAVAVKSGGPKAGGK